MIRHIRIRNFAIIENVDVDFYDGLNVITGETGAGKSIVIEAVSLALGSRADTAFVRSGTDKAIIQIIADYDSGNGSGEREYIITREISANGRSTCRINDEIVTLATLNNFCKGIADIHGQYDHQSLLNPERHIQLVDLYRKDEIDPIKSTVADLYNKYVKLTQSLQDLKAAQSESQRQKDFMEFELEELVAANLRIGEDNELENEIALLQNSEKIFENLTGAYQIASESEFSLLSAMKQISDMLNETADYSVELNDLSERIQSLYYDYEDACSSMRRLRDKTVFDPNALDAAINRAEIINKLKSKHNRDIPQLIAYSEELKQKLTQIENADEEQSYIEAEIANVKTALSEASKELSDVRKISASQLEKLIREQLLQLNFNDADFLINFTQSDYSVSGIDTVEFMITTNKGESLKPLSKIASGGEMSRIMLAFKKIIGDYDAIPTMIFDEIDSGISGIAASVVGRKLREISQSHQIICITHLPQIAAYAENNYRISKHTDDSMTYTTIDHLENANKVREIARLLGGESITETTLASANELIETSQHNFK